MTGASLFRRSVLQDSGTEHPGSLNDRVSYFFALGYCSYHEVDFLCHHRIGDCHYGLCCCFLDAILLCPRSDGYSATAVTIPISSPPTVRVPGSLALLVSSRAACPSIRVALPLIPCAVSLLSRVGLWP